MIIHNTAVGANRYINACFLKILVPCPADIYQSSCLSSADSLGFAGYADRTAADTDLYKICTAFCKEAEAFCVNDISCTNLYGISVT